MRGVKWGASIQNDHKWHIWLDKWPTKCQKSKHIISKLLRRVNLSEEITNSKFLKNLSKMRHFGDLKYVGVQSWKAAHLPTLEIRVEQKGNRVYKKPAKVMLFQKKLRKKSQKSSFFPISRFFSRRNLSYQVWITHAKFHQSRSNGSVGIRGEADLVKVAAMGENKRISQA